MQTIYIDISNKGVYPCIYAKQGDVNRKFLLVVTDGGVPFNCENTAISVWYDGDSGEGNYTHIGEEEAISVTENKITVSLIQQMLVNAGEGVLSVSVSDASGSQIGLWNICYCVEQKPGADSEEATQYYDAFSKTASDLAATAKTFTTDKTLSKIGSPADAAETGKMFVSVKNSIDKEKAERLAEIAVERARINNLSRLTEGSTTGDAELMDARVDAYGKIHENAGQAVRSQALLDEAILNQSNVKDALTKIQYYLKSAVFTDLRDTANFEPINNPAISPDWILTPGESGDVKSPVALDTTGTWEIRTRVFLKGNAGKGMADIMVTTRSDNTAKTGAILEALDFTTDTAYLAMYVNLNNSNSYVGCTVNRNQWLDIRCGYTGTKYFIEITDETGKVYSAERKTTILTPSGFFPTFGKSLNGYMTGKIDLSKTEMIVNGETAWRAVV